MSDPQFRQPVRRSYLVPALLALCALAAAIALAMHFFPATSLDIAHVRTQTLPTHTVYKADSIVLGVTHAEDVVYVATTVRVTNHLRQPVSLDDYALTFTAADGGELKVKAADKRDLASMTMSFPALTGLTEHPLARDVSLEPGASVEGTLLFPVAVPEAMWRARKSAVVEVDPYHLPALYQDLPAETAKP